MYLIVHICKTTSYLEHYFCNELKWSWISPESTLLTSGHFANEKLESQYSHCSRVTLFHRYCCKHCPFHMPLAELPHDSHDASMGLAELKASCRFKLLN